MFTEKQKEILKKGQRLFNHSDKFKRPLVSHLEFTSGRRGTLVFANGRLGLSLFNPNDKNWVKKMGKDIALLRAMDNKNTEGVLLMPFKKMKLKDFITLSIDFEYMDVDVLKKMFNIK